MAESITMNGGDGKYSYMKNSHFQAGAYKGTEDMINEVIAEKLDVRTLTSASNVFRVAALGCSVGPNTFLAMKNILENVENKYHSSCHSQTSPQTLEFQVFFNDHESNDFNTLFRTRPLDMKCFAAGVPGSFHGRLFPTSSLQYVHSSFALQLLSKVPEEVLDEKSTAWNKGRITYNGASREVANAYSFQFVKDVMSFLDCRAGEIVVGGMMVLILPGVPYGRTLELRGMVLIDFLGYALLDMVNEGVIEREKVDSFNIPVYIPSPDEMIEVIVANACFSIEKIELMDSKPNMKDPIDVRGFIFQFRAAFEGTFTKHFGENVTEELFARTLEKTEAISRKLDEWENPIEKDLLLVVLKRM